MEPKQGVFIAIDSADQAAQTAQLDLLRRRLENDGHAVATFNFPQTDQPSSYFVAQYLQNQTDKTVGPYTGTLFHALDHYQAADAIRQALGEGKIVLASGYVGAVAAQASDKFTNPAELHGYTAWLAGLEFGMLQNPAPTVSIIVQPDDSHPEVAALRRDLQASLTQVLPHRVEVTQGDTKAIWELIEPILPPKPDQSSKAYYIPDSLDQDSRAHYCKVIDEIMKRRHELQQKLLEYVANQPAGEQAKALQTCDLLLPVATSSTRLEQGDQLAALSQTINKQLPTHYSQDLQVVQLTSKWPANEISLVADIAYPLVDLSYNEISQAVADWGYNQKLETFESYAADWRDKQQLAPVLTKATYSWDVSISYATYSELDSSGHTTSMQRQSLTPRSGYDMPSIIEEADLVESFEECFDLSLQLHSYLQQAGYDHEAQYATLFGHKMRCQFGCNAGQLYSLYRYQGSLQLKKLTDSIHQKVSEVHPLVGDAISRPN